MVATAKAISKVLYHKHASLLSQPNVCASSSGKSRWGRLPSLYSL